MKKALLLIAVLLFLPPFTVRTEAAQFIQNGDFSKGLANYTTTKVSSGSFSGFPKFNVATNSHCIPSAQVGNPFLYIDVPGHADGYVEQQVVLPNAPTTFSFRSWGNQDPVTATISVITVGNVEHVLETYTPPTLEISAAACTSNSPITKSYDLTPFAGQTVKVRLRATSGGYNGTIADFDNLSISDMVAPPTYSGSVLYGLVNSATTGPPPCSSGDPVNCATGNLVETNTDFSIAGRGRTLQFARTFNCIDAASASAPGPVGYGWTHSYAAFLTLDSSGIVTVHQGNGSAISFTPSAGGFTAPPFVIATLQQNKDGTYTFTLPDQRAEIFSAKGSLLAETDRNGYRTTLAYNGSGKLTSVTDPAGRKLSFSYGANGLPASITDPLGSRMSYVYDSAKNLISVKDAGGNTTKFKYDGKHRLVAVTDGNGGVANNTYDSGNRVVSQTDAAGRTLSFTYGTATTTVTDGNGHVVSYAYTGNRLTSITHGAGTPEAATSIFTYDAAGNLTSTTDPNGNVWSATYDVRGNQLTRTDPLGRTTTYTYDSQNNLLTRTDALGFTTTLTYDGHGNLTSVSRPLGGTLETQLLSFQYGDTGHPGDLTATIDAEGYTWSLVYDAQGNLIQRIDPNGDTWTGAYNKIGWLTSFVGARGNAQGANPAQFQVQRVYSPLGDLTQSIDQFKNSTIYTYDHNRNLLTVKDANSHTLSFVYNADNQVTKVTRPDGTIQTNTYDLAWNLTGQTDGTGAATTYAYDSLNRRIQMTDPLLRLTKFSYDLAGNRIGTQNADNETVTFAYDNAKQLTGISYSDGVTPAVGFTYDANGRRIKMTDGTGTGTYKWDSLGRLTSSTDGAGNRVDYFYDLRGNVTGLNYPSGDQLWRSFDEVGQLASVSDWLHNTTNFQYDGSGNLVGIGYPNGVGAKFTYDRADRTTQIAYYRGNQTLLNFNYSRDKIGLLQSVGGTSYTYTPANELKTAAGSNVAFDKADNLIQWGSSALSYDAANQLSKITGSAGAPWNFTYDSSGNRVQAAGQSLTQTFQYDQAYRLIEFGANASYAYDGGGLRMSKTVGGVSRLFAWDISQRLPLLLADGGTQFIYGPNGLPLEQIGADGTVLWFHHDQLGSTRALTDQSGSITASYSYDAFGLLQSNNPGNPPVTPLLFAGGYTDAESGLEYLRARYYDPNTGQFLTRDPLVSVTRQPYLYAGGDPVNRADRTGMDDSPIVISVSPGTFSWGMNQSEANTTGEALVGDQLTNGVGHLPHVGVYSGPGTSGWQGCVQENNLSLTGQLAPGGYSGFHPYGDNPVTYYVTQNVHMSGDPINSVVASVVTTQVLDSQGNIVYQDRQGSVVHDWHDVVLQQEQGGANVNAFIQGNITQNQ